MSARRLCSVSASTLSMVVYLCSGSALAADTSDQADALHRYQQERAACLSGQSGQDLATCLREAAAALADARKGHIDDGATPLQQMREFERNAFQRCAPLPDEDRMACAARMEGMGTTSGSVESGGIYRELIIREVTVPSNSDRVDVPAD
jgi:hypothetical protein